MARDQRAGGGHAHEHRADPLADRRARLLAEGGVRLVADHDRVRVRDLAGVAHEPLVGLDRHGAAGGRLAAAVLQERRGDALLVAAVAQLAEELVHEVAAVGEDQDAAGARGLDEAERGDRLAGAGGVLEPEAPRGARVLLLRVGRGLLLGLLGGIPVERLLLDLLVALDLDLAGVELLHARPSPCRCGRSGARTRARSASRTGRRPGGPTASSRPRGAAPPRPAAARGRASARTRAATRRDGSVRPASSSFSAASSAARRALFSASAVAASSPSRTKDSRANSSARFSSSPETGEASATELLSATVKAFFSKGGTCRVARQETAGYARVCAVALLSPASSDGPGP